MVSVTTASQEVLSAASAPATLNDNVDRSVIDSLVPLVFPLRRKDYRHRALGTVPLEDDVTRTQPYYGCCPLSANAIALPLTFSSSSY